MSNDKYKNWRQSIDVDYFSLYIKSWFAYLSTLHELYKDIDISLGDGKLIKHAKEEIKIPENTTENIYKSISEIHKASDELILNDETLKKYHFYTFYKLNEKFKIKKELKNVTKFDYKIKIGKNNENKKQKILYIEIKDDRKTTKDLLKKNKKYFLEGKIPIDNFIKANNYKKDKIISDLQNDVTKNLNPLYTSLTEKQKQTLRKNFNKAIVSCFQSLRNNFEIDELFQPLPYENYTKPDEDKKLLELKWFVDFVYKLRNILFHSIINPLDDKWQPIYKNAFIVLRELVDDNIKKIDNRG